MLLNTVAIMPGAASPANNRSAVVDWSKLSRPRTWALNLCSNHLAMPCFLSIYIYFGFGRF